jgi:CRP/FNR family transcriptional regulator
MFPPLSSGFVSEPGSRPRTLHVPRRAPQGAASSLDAASCNGCSGCWLKTECMRCGVAAGELDRLHPAIVKRRVPRAAALYRTHDPLHNVFAVVSGAVKSVAVSSNGQEKVTSFHLPGEMFGLASIETGHYTRDAIAVDDSEICVIPYPRIMESSKLPRLQATLFRLLSLAITCHRALPELLESMTAEERVVAFLLYLARRHEQTGRESFRFQLSMTRIDIGSYLGMAHETVTRQLSHLCHIGVISLKDKEVEFVDVPRMRGMVAGW